MYFSSEILTGFVILEFSISLHETEFVFQWIEQKGLVL